MNKKQQLIEGYLRENGITTQSKIDEILSGFDLSRPVYKQEIWANHRLYQYVRNPSSSFNQIGIGNWFALKGASMSSLGIFSGGSGRSLTEFKLKVPIVALEGTAKKIAHNWSWAGGGIGGATQVFIPEKMFYALEVLGTHTER